LVIITCGHGSQIVCGGAAKIGGGGRIGWEAIANCCSIHEG